jgi:hypothetical protein
MSRERRSEAAGDEPERLEREGGKTLADEFLDELVPPELDWRRLVRRYPIPALLVAAATGYWLGRSRRGVAVAEAAVGAVALGVTSRVAGSVFELGDEDEILGI